MHLAKAANKEICIHENCVLFSFVSLIVVEEEKRKFWSMEAQTQFQERNGQRLTAISEICRSAR